jgi:ammonium transporter, Amt family
LFIIGLNIVMTSIIMVFIKYVLRIPLRMSEEMILVGDNAFSGEDAYTFGEQRPHVDIMQYPLSGEGENGVIQRESQSIGGSTEIGGKSGDTRGQ